MKYLAALLVLISLNCYGQCRLLILGGPYVSSEIAAAFYGNFIYEIENKSSCTIEMMLTDTLEEYYQKILKGQADMFFGGHHSLYSLSLRGFKPILQSPQILQAYLVVENSDKVKVKELTELSGKRVIVAGELSGTNLFLEDTLDNIKLEKDIIKVISDNHTNSAYQYLEGTADALVALNYFYDRIPDYLKKEDRIIKKSISESSYIMVRETLSGTLINHIQNSANKIKQITYTPYVPIKKSPYADRFEQKLRNFEKNMN